MFSPAVVGVYFMAQQVASIPQKLKTSFDPILGPVITKCLAEGDRKGVAKQVCQVGFWIIAAQAGLALMGAIPAEAVMGVVGPQFVAGALALIFLLVAEVLAATGAVAESALVYVARGRNLAISLGVLAFQVALSFAFIALLPQGASIAWQAATTALALAVAVAVGSILKAQLLKRALGSGVSPFRWPLLAAIAIAGAIGHVATRWAEWAELVVGVPLIFAAYVLVLWRFAFGPEDRALFRRRAAR